MRAARHPERTREGSTLKLRCKILREYAQDDGPGVSCNVGVDAVLTGHWQLITDDYLIFDSTAGGGWPGRGFSASSRSIIGVKEAAASGASGDGSSMPPR